MYVKRNIERRLSLKIFQQSFITFWYLYWAAVIFFFLTIKNICISVFVHLLTQWIFGHSRYLPIFKPCCVRQWPVPCGNCIGHGPELEWPGDPGAYSSLVWGGHVQAAGELHQKEGHLCPDLKQVNAAGRWERLEAVPHQVQEPQVPVSLSAEGEGGGHRPAAPHEVLWRGRCPSDPHQYWLSMCDGIHRALHWARRTLKNDRRWGEKHGWCQSDKIVDHQVKSWHWGRRNPKYWYFLVYKLGGHTMYSRCRI